MGLQILRDVESSVDIPEPIFKIYDVLEGDFQDRPNWRKMHEFSLWKHLCLCILSSNVTFELAKSAALRLAEQGILHQRYLLENRKALKTIRQELSKSIYLPCKKDGTFRKYRFPTRRSKDIVHAAHIMYANEYTIRKYLKEAPTETQARNHLSEIVPGLGLKESSHFLRNIRYSSSLAIIDAHIMRFLQELGLISCETHSVTPIEYMYLEKLMQYISKCNGLDLSILDNAIWHYMRHRTNL